MNGSTDPASREDSSRIRRREIGAGELNAVGRDRRGEVGTPVHEDRCLGRPGEGEKPERHGGERGGAGGSISYVQRDGGAGRRDRRSVDAEVGVCQHGGVGDGMQSRQRSHANRSPGEMRRPRTQSATAKRVLPGGLHLTHGQRSAARGHHEIFADGEHGAGLAPIVAGRRAEQLERGSLIGGPGTWCGIECPNLPRKGCRLPSPVEASALAIHLRRIGSRSGILRLRASRTVLKARERSQECRGPEVGETPGELSGGLTLGDWGFDLEQHRTAVESLFHAHDAHTSDGMPLQDGVLDRRSAPESWQQGCVHIDHSARWESQQLAPENVSVGDDDAELRVEPPQAGEEDISRRSLGLKHLQPCLRGGQLDRRLHEGGVRAAMRLVGLGDDGDDIVPLVGAVFRGTATANSGVPKKTIRITPVGPSPPPLP